MSTGTISAPPLQPLPAAVSPTSASGAFTHPEPTYRSTPNGLQALLTDASCGQRVPVR